MSEGRRRVGRGKADGPGLAETLVRTWLTRDNEFGAILDKVLDAGRQDVIDLAGRIVAERHRANADKFSADLMVHAGFADVGRGRCARLVVVTATTKGTKRPDAGDFGESVADSGFFEDKDRISFFPAWFPAAQLSKLSLCAIRCLVRDLADGKRPSVLDPDGADGSDNAIMLVGIDTSYTDEDDVEELDDVFESWKELNLRYYPEIADVGTPGPPALALFCQSLDGDP